MKSSYSLCPADYSFILRIALRAYNFELLDTSSAAAATTPQLSLLTSRQLLLRFFFFLEELL